MLDLKDIRQNSQEIEKKLKTKDASIELTDFLQLDENIRSLQTENEKLKAHRNETSKEIGEKKKEKEDVTLFMKKMTDVGNEISAIDHELKKLIEKRESFLSSLPNIPADNIPISDDAKDNLCLKTYGEKKKFSFPIKNHLELNEKLHLFDFQASAKITGASWPLYKNFGARLEWALLNYMLDIHIKNGYILISPPFLAGKKTLYNSGQLPKFSSQLFRLDDKDYPLYLIPTAEVVLNGMHSEDILPQESLPLKYVSFTPCFRREAGAAGKQERGLIRMHQFNKVELFCFSSPQKSDEVFDNMLCNIEEVLEGLDMHYRNMLLTTGEMSFSAAKTIDIEVFLPGQDRYYEVSSLSNCTDFQARRGKIRCKEKDKKPQFVHTLNGSGVATSRLMVALLENNQQKDGSILIPKSLQPYLEKEIIKIEPK